MSECEKLMPPPMKEMQGLFSFKRNFMHPFMVILKSDAEDGLCIPS